MADLKEWVQPGILGLIGTAVAALFYRRANNKVGHDNARADRESRFEENLQARYEAAMGKISQLNAEIDDLKGKLAEADKRLTIVQMIADGDPQRAVELSQDSAFVDVSRPFRARPQVKPMTSPMDPFQAADPYAPPPIKKPPR